MTRIYLELLFTRHTVATLKYGRFLTVPCRSFTKIYASKLPGRSSLWFGEDHRLPLRSLEVLHTNRMAKHALLRRVHTHGPMFVRGLSFRTSPPPSLRT